MNTLDGIRAVVFDKDGTLVDVEATWGPSMAAALTALIDDPDTRRRAAAEIGVHLETGTLVPDGPIIAESNDQICERLSPIVGVDAETLLADFEPVLYAHARTSVAPLPDVASTLGRLTDAGLWIGLATNDGEASARDQLDQLGWLGSFDSVIGYDSGFGQKPGPGMVLASLERAGVSVDELVMVGDTDTDLGAAHAAGCRTVLVHAPVATIEPTVRIDHLRDLPDLLGI